MMSMAHGVQQAVSPLQGGGVAHDAPANGSASGPKPMVAALGSKFGTRRTDRSMW